MNQISGLPIISITPEKAQQKASRSLPLTRRSSLFPIPFLQSSQESAQNANSCWNIKNIGMEEQKGRPFHRRSVVWIQNKLNKASLNCLKKCKEEDTISVDTLLTDNGEIAETQNGHHFHIQHCTVTPNEARLTFNVHPKQIAQCHKDLMDLLDMFVHGQVALMNSKQPRQSLMQRLKQRRSRSVPFVDDTIELKHKKVDVEDVISKNIWFQEVPHDKNIVFAVAEEHVLYSQEEMNCDEEYKVLEMVIELNSNERQQEYIYRQALTDIIRLQRIEQAYE